MANDEFDLLRDGRRGIMCGIHGHGPRVCRITEGVEQDQIDFIALKHHCHDATAALPKGDAAPSISAGFHASDIVPSSDLHARPAD